MVTAKEMSQDDKEALDFLVLGQSGRVFRTDLKPDQVHARLKHAESRKWIKICMTSEAGGGYSVTRLGERETAIHARRTWS